MYCLDKKAIEALKKNMTKKEWKRYCWNFRGEPMPRPTAFDDKRNRSITRQEKREMQLDCY